MQISKKYQQEYELSCLRRRACSLLLDYFFWYLIYSIMVLIFYSKTYGMPEVSGNLSYYKDAFDTIIKTSRFSYIYLVIICALEIVIPLLTNGQSITKKIFKIKVITRNNSKIRLLIRCIVKIMILNPYGVIAYTIGDLFNRSYINYISNMLSIIFIVSSILVFKYGESLHDKIAKTYISLI